jgi:hypothetical protein
MSEDENGGPAFAYGNWEHGGDSGMTLRDYFAGQALAGFCNGVRGSAMEAAYIVQCVAPHVYEVADAMLEARKAPTGETS